MMSPVSIPVSVFWARAEKLISNMVRSTPDNRSEADSTSPGGIRAGIGLALP